MELQQAGRSASVGLQPHASMQARISGEHSQPRIIRSIMRGISVGPNRRSSNAPRIAAAARVTIPPATPARIDRASEPHRSEHEQPPAHLGAESTVDAILVSRGAGGRSLAGTL
jgi:hypothetical protein